jgi:hypothetical protein
VLEALIQADFDDVIEYFRNENSELIDFETNSNKQIANKASQVGSVIPCVFSPVPKTALDAYLGCSVVRSLLSWG